MSTYYSRQRIVFSNGVHPNHQDDYQLVFTKGSQKLIRKYLPVNRRPSRRALSRFKGEFRPWGPVIPKGGKVSIQEVEGGPIGKP